MVKYQVEFFETIRHLVTLDAEGEDDATDKAENVYYGDGVGEVYSESSENSIGTVTKVE